MKTEPIPDFFKNGVRVLHAIFRPTDGYTHKNARSLFSTSPEEWDFCYGTLRGDPNLRGARIYTSVNARNLQGAVDEFHARQLRAFEKTDCGHRIPDSTFYRDCSAQFLSCLMQPSNRADKNFLWDVDPDEWEPEVPVSERLQMLLFHLYMNTRVLHVRHTPKGFHVVTEPFNPKLIDGFEPMKNALLYVDSIPS